MTVEPVLLRRKLIRVPCDVLADQRLAECSGLARLLFAGLWPSAVADPAQTISKVAPRAVGWLMSASGEPANIAQLAARTGVRPSMIEGLLAELYKARAIALSDSGAWGLVGWGARSPEAARTAKSRAAKAAAKAAVKPARARRAAA